MHADDQAPAGTVIVLNGAPRSGKSSIATAIQQTFDGAWLNLGTDVFAGVVPPGLRPGIGLRPDAEAPAVEEALPALYAALYDSIAAHARHGFNVVVDVGHHDAYSRPLGVLADAARRLAGLAVLFVGVRCPLEVIMQRRDAGERGGERSYEQSGPHGEVPEAVRRWQEEVHRDKSYDVEVDTSVLSADECAERIRRRLATLGHAATSFELIAASDGPFSARGPESPR